MSNDAKPAESAAEEIQPGTADPSADAAAAEAAEMAEAMQELESMTAEELLQGDEPTPVISEEGHLKAIIEAIVYVTEEPLTSQQIAAALELPLPKVEQVLAALVEDCAREDRGVSIRQIAGGYKMSTKPEHNDVVKTFVKKLRAPLKLSLAALETLAVIAYKQPVTIPEVQEIRGVQGAGVIKTLLERKLIATAGRKNVVGKPMMYKTTREFLVQFGLKDLAELPTLKEFEEMRRLALPEDVEAEAPRQPAQAEEPSVDAEAKEA